MSSFDAPPSVMAESVEFELSQQKFDDAINGVIANANSSAKRSKRLQIKKEIQHQIDMCRPVVIQQVPVPIIVQTYDPNDPSAVQQLGDGNVQQEGDGVEKIEETINEIINSSVNHQNGLIYGRAISELQKTVEDLQAENKKLKQRMASTQKAHKRRVSELDAVIAERDDRIQMLSKNVQKHRSELKQNKRPYIGANASYRCKAKLKAERVLKKYFDYDDENFKALFRDLYGESLFPRMSAEQTYEYQQKLKLSCNAMDRTRAMFKKMFREHPFASKAAVLAYRKTFERPKLDGEEDDEMYEEVEMEEGQEELEEVEELEETYEEADEHEMIEVVEGGEEGIEVDHEYIDQDEHINIEDIVEEDQGHEHYQVTYDADGQPTGTVYYDYYTPAQ
uniref:ORF6C domain-containing protein n=1 Tax=Panagrellus redivivus TaxID=6233 RepID=A0A7E4VQ19_PANRE